MKMETPQPGGTLNKATGKKKDGYEEVDSDSIKKSYTKDDKYAEQEMSRIIKERELRIKEELDRQAKKYL